MAEKSVSTDSLAVETGPAAYSGKKLRVAMVGCGGIAQVHLEQLKGFPDVEVVAADEAVEVLVAAAAGEASVAAAMAVAGGASVAEVTAAAASVAAVTLVGGRHRLAVPPRRRGLPAASRRVHRLALALAAAPPAGPSSSPPSSTS